MQNIGNHGIYYGKSLFRMFARFTGLALIVLLTGFFVTMTENTASAQTISSVTKMGQITGCHEEISGFTPLYNGLQCGYAQVCGTDMGSNYPFTASNGTKKERFLFGDTFSESGSTYGGTRNDWRRNTMAYTTDSVASDGIQNLNFLMGNVTYPDGHQSYEAREVIPASNPPAPLGPYPSAGWATEPYEFIWGLEYNVGYTTAGVKSTKLFMTSDEWATAYEATKASNGSSARTPRGQGTGTNYYSNFDLVYATKALYSGTSYIVLAGLPGGRAGGIKLLRIRVADAYGWWLGTHWPEIYTSTGWKSMQNKPTAKSVTGLTSVGEGSALYLPAPFSQIMALNMNYYGTQVDARFGGQLPENSYGSPKFVIYTQDCSANYADYKNAYGPILLPDYTTCTVVGSGGYCDVYFLISRMAGDATAGNCQTYTCSSNTGTPWPCHKAYNTFLIKMRVTK